MTIIDDFYTSFGGIIWSKKAIRTFHANTCLYLSKGSADYVGNWNVNEFFIPRGNNKNLLDVLEKLEFLDPKKLTGNNAIPPVDPSYGEELMLKRGMADSGFHFFCSLILHTETTFDTFDPDNNRPVSTVRTQDIWRCSYCVSHLLFLCLFIYLLTYSLTCLLTYLLTY